MTVYLISPKSHPIPNRRSRDIKKVQKTVKKVQKVQKTVKKVQKTIKRYKKKGTKDRTKGTKDIKKVQKTHKKRQNVLGPQGNTREKKFFNFGSKNVLYGALGPAESISGLRKIFEKFPGKLESKNRFATFGQFGHNFPRLKWTPNKVYIFLTARGRSFT